MSRTDALLAAYSSHVAIPWATGLSGGEKVWFSIYEKTEERRLRLHLPEFENATRSAGHDWHEFDLTDEFARWFGAEEYRESYFESPDNLGPDKLIDFLDYLVSRIRPLLESSSPDGIVALFGLGGLFGFVRVSALIHRLEPLIRGRLLVFFPGEYENGNYRFLDARDGWSYRAVPILPSQGALSA